MRKKNPQCEQFSNESLILCTLIKIHAALSRLNAPIKKTFPMMDKIMLFFIIIIIMLPRRINTCFHATNKLSINALRGAKCTSPLSFHEDSHASTFLGNRAVPKIREKTFPEETRESSAIN
jgi:hypothetical protein